MIELWGGIECTVNRVGNRYVDQIVRTGHQHRLDDLDRRLYRSTASTYGGNGRDVKADDRAIVCARMRDSVGVTGEERHR